MGEVDCDQGHAQSASKLPSAPTFPVLEVDIHHGPEFVEEDFESQNTRNDSGPIGINEESDQRFHAESIGEYFMPNDETEQERLDIQHYLMFLALNGKLHVAPIETMEGGLHYVLDIATGIGNWAIAFANAYPSINVIGTDISRMQPENIPSNCTFVIEDAEKEWNFHQSFDYIHGRALVTCFQSHKTVFEHAFKALRSGGYIELQDAILPMRFLDSSGDGTALKTWSDRFMAGGAALGKDLMRGGEYKAVLEQVGFVDVVELHTQLPIGTWPARQKMKTLGWWLRKDLLHGLEGMSMAIQTRGLGLSSEEVESHLAEVRKDILSNNVHAYYQVILVYGRKP